MPRTAETDTRPGDLVGRDSSGRLRVDRVIPLPWLIGMLSAVCVNAAAMYYGQQEMISKVAELKTDVKALANAQAHLTGRDIENSLRLQMLERRLDSIETSKVRKEQ